MKVSSGPQKIGDIFASRRTVKPPAYPWQDLALRVIAELGVPAFKKGSVFKVCKEMKREIVLQALNDTKELCPAGAKWKYFFKIIDSARKS